jgi:hypothetical protein
MMTRVRYILAAVFVLTVVGFAIAAMWPPAPGVTQANFDRLEIGMTLAEVEAIYGRQSSATIGGRDHYWRCPSGDLALVGFTKAGGLTVKSWPEVDETIVRKIRRWLFRRCSQRTDNEMKKPRHNE